MAYDLPFVSKARKNIGKLPGETQPEWPVQPMSPAMIPGWGDVGYAVNANTPSWLRPDKGFRAESLTDVGRDWRPVFQGAVSPLDIPTTTPSPTEPVGPIGFQGFGSRQDFIPAEDVPNPVFTDEQGQMLSPQELAIRDDARPADPSLLPRAQVQHVGDPSEMVQLSEYTERTEANRIINTSFGRQIQKEIADPQSILSNTQVNEQRNAWSYGKEYSGRPGDLLHTGIPIIDNQVGVLKGVVDFGGAFLQGPIFWPEEIAVETAFDIGKLLVKSVTQPFDLDYGDIPTIFTEGPWGALTNFQKRPIWQQILMQGGVFGGIGAAKGTGKALRRLDARIPTVHAYQADDPYKLLPRDAQGNIIPRDVAEGVTDLPRSLEEAGLSPAELRAVYSSAVASGADLGERSIIAGFQPVTRTVLGELSEDAVSSANLLDEAVLDLISNKVAKVTKKVDSDQPTESFLDGNNILGLRGDIALGTRHETTRAAMWRGLVDITPGEHVDYNDILLPIQKHAQEKKVHAISLANDASAQIDFIINQVPTGGKRGARGVIFGGGIDKLFPTTPEGLIPSLGVDDLGSVIDDGIPKGAYNHAPTLQDVAARLDKYRPHLSDEQINALESIREILRPWRELIDEVGIPLGNRRDVAASVARGGDGFYIPRGDAQEIGKEIAYMHVNGKYMANQHLSKDGFQMAESFPSMAAGIAGNHKYASVGETIRSYIMDVSEHAISKNMNDQMKRMTDDEGLEFVESTAMRVQRRHGDVRKAYNAVTSRQRGKIAKIFRSSGMSTALAREASRAMRGIEEGVERWTRAGENVEKYKVQVADAEAARDALVESSHLRAEIAQDIVNLRDELMAGGRLLDENEEAFFNKYNLLDEQSEAMRIEGGAFEAGLDGAYARNYFAGLHRIHTTNDEIDQLLDMRDSISEIVEGFIEDQKFLKELDVMERADEVTKRRVVRSASNKLTRQKVAEAEVKLLEKEQARALRQVKATKGRQVKLEAEMIKDAREIEAMSRQIARLKWTLNEAKLREKPQYRDRILIQDTPGLHNYDLPRAMANSWNRAARESLSMRGGKASEYIKALRIFNQTFLAWKATGDDGVLGIQGLLGMFGTRGAFTRGGKAGEMIGAFSPGGRDFRDMMELHWKSWGDPHVLGAFLLDFNDKARKAGRLLTYEWEKHGLRVGGAQTEFALGLGPEWLAKSKIGSAAKMFNRAFGYYGDARRMTWADDMLQEELSKGRSLEDLFNSGDIERIAEIANNMTGWSKHRAGGDLGEFALLAPRYFQSRLDTTLKAALGMIPHKTQNGIQWGRRIDQRMARRTMLRTVGHAAVMTYLVNEAQGKDTDFSPFIWEGGKPWEGGNFKWNPDFMAMWVGNKKVKILGPWDSIARLLTITGAGIFGSAFGQTHHLRQLSAIRAMTSGSVSLAWSFIANRNWGGKPTMQTPVDIGMEVGRAFIPMVGEQGAEHAMQEWDSMIDGDWGAVGRTATGVGLEFFGMKTSIANLYDTRDFAVNEHLEKIKDDPDALTDFTKGYQGDPDFSGVIPAFVEEGYPEALSELFQGPQLGRVRQKYLTTNKYHYEGLSKNSRKNIIDQDLDVQAKLQQLEKKRADRGPAASEEWSTRIGYYHETKQEQIGYLRQVLDSGQLGEPRRKALQSYMTIMHTMGDNLLDTPEMREYAEKSDPKNLLDYYIRLYQTAPLEVKNPLTDQLDYAKQDAEQENILLKAAEDLGDDFDEADFKVRITHGDKVVDAAFAEYDRDQELLESLWEVENKVVAGFSPPVQKAWKKLEELSSMNDYLSANYLEMNNILKDVQKAISSQKKYYRRYHPEVDIAYQRLGYKGKPQTVYGIAERNSIATRTEASLEAIQTVPDQPVPGERPEIVPTDPTVPTEMVDPGL